MKLKNLLANKNVVTIIGAVLIVIVLFAFYKWRVNVAISNYGNYSYKLYVFWAIHSINSIKSISFISYGMLYIIRFPPFSIFYLKSLSYLDNYNLNLWPSILTLIPNPSSHFISMTASLNNFQFFRFPVEVVSGDYGQNQNECK